MLRVVSPTARLAGWQLTKRAQAFLPAAPIATLSQVNDAVAASKGSSIAKVQHYSSYALAAAIPANFLVGPFLPVDVLIGLVVPLHAHIGLNSVIQDYIYGAPRGVATALLYVFTGVSTIGLLKVNLTDDGITAGIKSLWKDKK